MIRIIGRVGDEMRARHVGDQPFGLGDVANLTAGEDEPQRIAQGIDGDMDLGAQPAPRASDGLILSPPFAPAAC